MLKLAIVICAALFVSANLHNLEEPGESWKTIFEEYQVPFGGVLVDDEYKIKELEILMTKIQVNHIVPTWGSEDADEEIKKYNDILDALAKPTLECIEQKKSELRLEHELLLNILRYFEKQNAATSPTENIGNNEQLVPSEMLPILKNIHSDFAKLCNDEFHKCFKEVTKTVLEIRRSIQPR